MHPMVSIVQDFDEGNLANLGLPDAVKRENEETSTSNCKSLSELDASPDGQILLSCQVWPTRLNTPTYPSETRSFGLCKSIAPSKKL